MPISVTVFNPALSGERQDLIEENPTPLCGMQSVVLAFLNELVNFFDTTIEATPAVETLTVFIRSIRDCYCKGVEPWEADRFTLD